MINSVMYPLAFAVIAALAAFAPNETAEMLGLIDLRPGKWDAP